MQQGYQRESGCGGVLGGRPAPSEVPAGLPVSTPTLWQGGSGSASRTKHRAQILEQDRGGVQSPGGPARALNFLDFWEAPGGSGQAPLPRAPPQACPLCSPRRLFQHHVHGRLELLRVSGHWKRVVGETLKPHRIAGR